ncbi:MAG: oligosaccharide flippase family protein [Gemmataceae bacterium]|nr:oligosaccharide flippase family protein [Gemmataceae bacterium]MDW8265875.1 flippase [Gemmataceae bacterium]
MTRITSLLGLIDHAGHRLAAATQRRRLAVNAAVNWTGHLLQLAVAFYLSPILVHGLGNQRYGLWTAIESILAYLTLVALGLAASVVRYVARHEARREWQSLNEVVNTSLALFSLAGLAVLAVTAGLSAGLGSLLTLPPAQRREAHWLLGVLGTNLAVSLPLSVFPAILDGLGRYTTKNAVMATVLLLRVPMSLIVIRHDLGLVGLALGTMACNLLQHGLLAVLAVRALPSLRLSRRCVTRATFRRIRSYSTDALLAMVAGRISFQTDSLVIAALLGPAPVTFFVLGARLVEHAKAFLRSATTVLTPAISSLDARGEAETIRRLYLTTTRYVLWLVLPIQAGFLVFGRPFLRLWMGPSYAEAGYPVLVVLAVPLGLCMSQSVSGRICYGLGRLRLLSRAALVEALVNLTMSLALAQPLGLVGVALGTAIPNLVFNTVILVSVCRMLALPVRQYLRQSFLAPAVGAGALAGGWLLAAGWHPPDTWPALLALGAAGVLGYGAGALGWERGWWRRDGIRLGARRG